MKCLYSAIAALCISTHAFADLPLTIAELITEKGQLRLETSFNYATTDNKSVFIQAVEVNDSNQDTVTIPMAVNHRENKDLFTLSTGIRYGLFVDWEIYTRIAAQHSQSKIDTNGVYSSESDNKFDSVTIGINHQFSNDNDTPALLVFLDTQILENVGTDEQDILNAKTWNLGVITYRSIDPIVLAMGVGYNYTADKHINNQTVDSGDMWYLNPNIAFAVNTEITLTSGLQYAFYSDSYTDGKVSAMGYSRSSLELGLGYAPTDKLILNLKSTSSTSGTNFSNLNLNLVYKF